MEPDNKISLDNSDIQKLIRERIENDAKNINDNIYRYYESEAGDGDIEVDERIDLLDKFLQYRPLGTHAISTYDDFLNRAKYSFGSRRLQLPNGNSICFSNLQIMPPYHTKDGERRILTPKLCRESAQNYSAEWVIDIFLTEGNCSSKILDKKLGVKIADVPIMIKSSLCHLRDKTAEELMALGEDPKDPGGYFIVKGHEKVTALQEQLEYNKIFLMRMKTKENPVARLTAMTSKGTTLVQLALDKVTGTVMKIRFTSISLKIGEKHKSFNVLRVLMLLGVAKSELFSAIGRFMKPQQVERCTHKLYRNLIDLEIRPDNTEIFSRKMGVPELAKFPEELFVQIQAIFDSDLFPHINETVGPDGESDFERDERIRNQKIDLLCLMIARFCEHLAGFRDLDDRDSYSNKKAGGAAFLMEKLLRGAWRANLSHIQKKSIQDKKVKDFNAIVEVIASNIITDSFIESFNTSNWGVRSPQGGSPTQAGVAQVLPRDSRIATISMINTVDVSLSRTSRDPTPRAVHDTQCGVIDPTNVQEGKNCGITKNLCITAQLTLERSDSYILRWLYGDIDNAGRKYRTSFEEAASDAVTEDGEATPEDVKQLIVNGKFIGWYNQNVIDIYEELLFMRRSGEIEKDISLVLEPECLNVVMSPHRLIRPLLIVDDEQNLIIDSLKMRQAPIHDLFVNGAMEYISSWEQEYVKIAMSPKDITDRLENIKNAKIDFLREEKEYLRLMKTFSSEDEKVKEAKSKMEYTKKQYNKAKQVKAFTHCEIHPLALLSVGAAMIFWGCHNVAPRNTYQVGMGKQALGIYNSNWMNRFDGKIKIFPYTTRALVEPEFTKFIGMTEDGMGENVIMAFMPYPYNEEDSYVFNQYFLDNGGERIIKFLEYKTVAKSTANGSINQKIGKPQKIKANEPKDRYNYIDENGLPFIGAYLKQGDCVTGRLQIENGVVSNASTFLKVGDEGIVDKIVVSSNGLEVVVKVRLSIMARPQEGDKLATRNAQKATIGIVLHPTDMFYNKDGVSPDVITNSSCVPSRMTVAYPMEMVGGKYAAFAGERVNGGFFESPDLDKYKPVLERNGYSFTGEEYVTSGTTGRPLKNPIGMGLVYLQCLRHLVKGKIQARSVGSVLPMTRQPPKGRGSGGGLRIGEMEKDCYLSFGASSILKERLMEVSDAYETVFCKTCGSFAIDNATRGTYSCRKCKGREFGRCTIPYALKFLIHILAAPGLNLHLEFATIDEYKKLINSTIEEDVEIEEGSDEEDEDTEVIDDEDM